jgi:UDP-N-acetylmuramoylalanine-D-glutamate ligase
MNKKLINKKIGIWGYGIVGKSITKFFKENGYQCVVTDKDPTVAERVKKDFPDTTFFTSDALQTFFTSVDFIFSSPGVDIGDY